MCAVDDAILVILTRVPNLNRFLLGSLRNLRRLSVQNNRLERITGLAECIALEELYLSHNGLQSLEVRL